MVKKIEWTDATWNPVRGCQIVGAGCANCYAMKQAHRFSGQGQPYEGLTKMSKSGPIWTGAVRLVPEVLDAPLRWRKSRRIFVNSMSDLFHEDVPDEFIDRVFAVMALARWHQFQVLTKRPERMHEYVADEQTRFRLSRAVDPAWFPHDVFEDGIADDIHMAGWPLPNVWTGVSCEDQSTSDERIPLLLQTPATVRFVSYEPALAPVDFTRLRSGDRVTIDALAGCARIEHPEDPGVHGGGIEQIKIDGLSWVIVGGESGHRARPFDLAWARSLRDQCKASGVPFFFKQLGARSYDSEMVCGTYAPHDKRMPTKPDGAGGTLPLGNLVLLKDRKGGNPEEWPRDLRVREFP